MNCPNCGAENEAEAHFCVECGTPLENQLGAVTPPTEEGDDKTIISKAPLVAEDAKTVSVTQDDVAVAAAESEPEATMPSSVEPEPELPPATSPPLAESGSNGRSGLANQRNIIIIAIVALIILCCCCATLGVVVMAGSGVIEEILYELGLASLRLFFV